MPISVRAFSTVVAADLCSGLAGMATNWNSVGGGFGDSDAEGIHWQNLNMPYFLVKEDDLQDINDVSATQAPLRAHYLLTVL